MDVLYENSGRRFNMKCKKCKSNKCKTDHVTNDGLAYFSHWFCTDCSFEWYEREDWIPTMETKGDKDAT